MLKSFGQFRGECALSVRVPVFWDDDPDALRRRLLKAGTLLRPCSRRTTCRDRTANGGALRRLSRVCPQDFVLEWSTVEAANNRLHLVSGWRFHECESFGFLRFVVSNYFDRIRDQIFRRKPLFNVIGGDPDRQVAQKDSKTHSFSCVYSPEVIFLVKARTRGGNPFS